MLTSRQNHSVRWFEKQRILRKVSLKIAFGKCFSTISGSRNDFIDIMLISTLGSPCEKRSLLFGWSLENSGLSNFRDLGFSCKGSLVRDCVPHTVGLSLVLRPQFPIRYHYAEIRYLNMKFRENHLWCKLQRRVHLLHNSPECLDKPLFCSKFGKSIESWFLIKSWGEPT